MSYRQMIRSNRPESTLKTGSNFTDANGTEWIIVASAADGTAAVESEEAAGEYNNGVIFLCEDGDTYGAHGVPEFIVKNGSWYNNQLLADTKKDELVLKKRGAFRPSQRSRT